ncbi:MAG: DUF2079 domain-containing protein [Candidatus Omnitrophica bacterium]|nr:DUF2079 domain-containing protein [Candidatus Omnitrophota bacterium]MDD5310189.1 DUF2079 domain-containing protein [Candidatus Omnitrophota bacterium]MDD5546234.1 DUF2079 domain-containing protein [Candidatus Omnitrophota bacterium]
MKRIDAFCLKFADRLVWASILAYILAFGCLCFLKYQSFNYTDWDLASDAVVFWNSVHGKLLYFPFLEEVIFGAHLYLIMFLIMPIYAVFQSPLTILFLQSAFLGLAAYPLYLLAGTRLNKTFSLAVVLAYLLYPALGFANLFETHFDTYEIFFLFFALYYFEKGNFKRFLICIFLTLLCKENASLIVFMMGIYAMARRKQGKWVFVPLLAGAIWFLVSVKMIIPYFAKDADLYPGGFIFGSHYRHLGTNLAEMVKTMILHPIGVAAYAFTPRKILYLIQLFLPVGFLGLLSPLPLLVIIPILMQNLLASPVTVASIYFHYTAIMIPFIFFSVICGLNKLARYGPIAGHQAKLLFCFLGFVVFSGIYLQAPQFNLAWHVSRYQAGDYSREKEKLVKAIPGDTSAIATFQFLPKLSNRHDLYSMHFVSTGHKMYTNVKYEPPENLQYALIDFNEPLMIAAFFPPSAPGNIRSFLEAGDWRVVRAFNDTVLFGKGSDKGPRLCEAVINPKIQYPMNVDLNKEIVFLGYDIVDDDAPGSGLLHMVYYWKRIKGNSRPEGFFIQFSDANGNARFRNEHMFGYRAYLRDEWKPGQIVKEHNYILIPSGLDKGDYGISFGPFVFEKDLDQTEKADAK